MDYIWILHVGLIMLVDFEGSRALAEETGVV